LGDEVFGLVSVASRRHSNLAEFLLTLSREPAGMLPPRVLGRSSPTWVMSEGPDRAQIPPHFLEGTMFNGTIFLNLASALTPSATFSSTVNGSYTFTVMDTSYVGVSRTLGSITALPVETDEGTIACLGYPKDNSTKQSAIMVLTADGALKTFELAAGYVNGISVNDAGQLAVLGTYGTSSNTARRRITMIDTMTGERTIVAETLTMEGHSQPA